MSHVRSGNLLLPLLQEGIEIDSSVLDEAAKGAGWEIRAGMRRVSDVPGLPNVEEVHLIVRHEGGKRAVVFRDQVLWRDAKGSEGYRLGGQSVDYCSGLATRLSLGGRHGTLLGLHRWHGPRVGSMA
jgi:hypothetical protein